MKEVEIVSKNNEFTVAEIGRFEDLMEYSYFSKALNANFPGKVFLGEKLQSTSTEISFQIMPPKTIIPFVHKHVQNEEIYIFLKGNGQFQVEDKIFDVSEGSIIRVAPEAKRTGRNNSEGDLIFMVIQAKNNSMEKYESSDGVGVGGPIDWDKLSK